MLEIKHTPNLSDSNGNNVPLPLFKMHGDRIYRVIDGCWYPASTPQDLLKTLEHVRRTQTRVHIVRRDGGLTGYLRKAGYPPTPHVFYNRATRNGQPLTGMSKITAIVTTRDNTPLWSKPASASDT